jgi:hypothetical protein
VAVEGEVIRVAWTRAELTAMREAVELTPYFEGRPAVRDTIRDALRPGLAPSSTIVFERAVAERFAGRLVTSDLPTALAKVRLLRAIRDADDSGARGSEQDTQAA